MWGKALPGLAGYLRRQPAMHPSVCALRRIHLPLQGRLWGDCRLKGSPARGAVGVSRLRGAAPCLANTLPGRLDGGGRSAAGEIARPTLRPWAGGNTKSAAARQARRWADAGITPLPRGRRPAVPGSASRLPCNAGRAFTPAVGPCGSARPRGRCQHRPLRMRGKVLPGLAGYLRRQPAMHPSVCALRRSHLPLQGRLWGGCRLKGSPVRGCGVERRLRRIQRDGAGAAVAECKHASACAA